MYAEFLAAISHYRCLISAPWSSFADKWLSRLVHPSYTYQQRRGHAVAMVKPILLALCIMEFEIFVFML